MLEFINQSNLLDNDVFVLAQATSPFTSKKHFNEGLGLFESYDSIVSCSINKRFFWNKDGPTLNYDINNRPRRQDFKGTLIENGAFYINNVKNIKETKNRISGNIGIYKMPEYSSTELDESLDWLVAEKMMHKYVLTKIFKKYERNLVFLNPYAYRLSGQMS